MSPTPVPPGETSPSFMLTSGIMPPSGVKLSWPEFDRAGRRAGGGGGEEARGERAEADLLALHVPAGLIGRQRLIHPPPGQLRVAVLLEQPRHQGRGEPQDAHDGEHDAALALAAHHLAVGDRERRTR